MLFEMCVSKNANCQSARILESHQWNFFLVDQVVNTFSMFSSYNLVTSFIFHFCGFHGTCLFKLILENKIYLSDTSKLDLFRTIWRAHEGHGEQLPKNFFTRSLSTWFRCLFTMSDELVPGSRHSTNQAEGFLAKTTILAPLWSAAAITVVVKFMGIVIMLTKDTLIFTTMSVRFTQPCLFTKNGRTKDFLRLSVITSDEWSLTEVSKLFWCLQSYNFRSMTFWRHISRRLSWFHALNVI